MLNSSTSHHRQEAGLMFGAAPECSTRDASSAPLAVGQRHQDLLDPILLDALSTCLREPLAVIEGAAETLLRRGERLSAQERHEFLSAIVEASEHFEDILRHVLPSSL